MICKEEWTVKAKVHYVGNKECVHEINITRGFKGKNTDQIASEDMDHRRDKQTVVITSKLLTFTTLDS